MEHRKKVNLTGAVSAVSAEDLASKPVMSTAQALAGLAPGLSVLQTSGRPGQGATVKNSWNWYIFKSWNRSIGFD